MQRLLTATLVLALTACGGGNGGDEDATDTPTEGTPDVDDDTDTEPADDPEVDILPDDGDDPVPDAEEDAEEDVETDGTPDAEEDASEDIEDEMSECAVVLECAKSCMPTDSACLGRCMAGISTSTEILLRAIITCATTTVSGGRCGVCATGTDTAACWTCLETACPTEFSDCVGT